MERWLKRCDGLLLWAAVAATFCMMFLTSADAASRYLLNRPITGAYELTEKYLLTASVFLGMCYAYRGGVFIRVAFLVDRLPPALKLLADHLAQVVSLLCCLLFAVATTQQALRALSSGTTLSTLPLPLGPAYFLVPIGFSLLALLMLFDLPRVREGKSNLFGEDAPTA